MPIGPTHIYAALILTLHLNKSLVLMKLRIPNEIFSFSLAGQCDLMSFPWTETSLSTAKARIQAGVKATEQVTPGQTRKDALEGSECSIFRGIQAEAGSAT